MRTVRYLDLVVLVLALPLFVLADLPLGGYALGGGVYLLQRAIAIFTTRRAAAADDVRKRVALIAGGMVGRGWLAGLTILLVGLAAGDDVGLAAAVLFIALFTVYFTMQMILRPFEQGDPSA